jgi:hypothetical protein
LAKVSRFLLVVAALAIAAIVSRHATAQPTSSADDESVLKQYEQLVLSLSKRGDSNTVAGISRLVSGLHAERDATEIVVTVHVLDSLRLGRTNEAMQLLETRLDGTLTTFDVSTRGRSDLKHAEILKMAKEYRSKYPRTSDTPGSDTGIARSSGSSPK